MTGSRFLFGCTIFLASFLLFLIEPIAAKQLLPIFGGSAAVWITCLVFFQTALLLAYLYAHWLGRHPRWQLHSALLLASTAVAIWFAIQNVDLSSLAAHPILAIFAALAISIGLPFLALGATSPLLQLWLARVEIRGIPYRLFALSNLSSLLALGIYPVLIEPVFALRTQRLAWTCGFSAFAVLSVVLAWKTRAAAAPQLASTEFEPPTAPLTHKLLWLLLPMGAAMQLSAVTSYITANIAPIPLLWILPLAVYLVTIILAFQFPARGGKRGVLGLPGLTLRNVVTRILVILLALLGYQMVNVDSSQSMLSGILFFLVELFVAGLFLHSEVCALRPQRPSESTLFYLLFAAGGALGSFFIGIAAPLLFRFNYDLALAFWVTALLACAVTWSSGWAQRLLWSTASILLLVLVFLIHTAYSRNTPVAVRNFYGALRVKQTVGYPGATIRTLSNGSIQHGTQIFSPELRRTPTTYYAEDSGVGIALRNCCADGARNIGVIGLGAGTVAAYGRPGDSIRFYEINPAVIPIARNLFTYMRDSPAHIDIVEGDARTSLAHEPSQQFNVLVVDAFSGDAIPLHLLTAEAVSLYKKHLAPGGILAFHISNQHVNLEPEIVQLAKSADMYSMRVSSPPNEDRGEFSATWMLVSADPTFFQIPEVFNNAHQPTSNPRVRLWTDDYSSLLPILRW